jgi:phenylpropionate dioxygenase-like ring-hydroxylating dioxygenase large terminal subunit
VRRETQIDLGRRLLAHLDAGTTTLAPDVFRNPVAAYTSPARAALERARLFRARPLLVGLSGLMPSAGDWLAEDLAGVPVLLVRGGDGRLRGFANACRHRGARLAEGCGAGKRVLACPYHGWTYDLDGRLVAVPGERGFPGLDRAAHGLRRLPVVEEHGLVWVRPSPGDGAVDAPPGPLGAEIADYGLAGWHHFATRTLRPQINWKLGVDTFLEAYHLATLHAATVAPIFVGDLCAADAFGPHHRMVAVRRSFAALRERPEAEWDVLRHTIVLYTLFPNTILVHQADHVEVWRFFPDPVRDDACVAALSLYVPEPPATGKARAHWEANLRLALDAVAQEDFPLAEGIQRGFTAGATEGVVYGRNEPALIHFHATLRAALESSAAG